MDQWLEEGNEFVEAAAVLVRKRGNEDFLIVLVGYEEGVDEHRLGCRCQSRSSRIVVARREELD